MTSLARLLVFAPLACTPQTQLKDLSGGELALSFAESTLVVYIHPAAKRPRPDEPRRTECAKLSMNIKASFNGVPLKRLTGIYAFGDLTYDRGCMLELAFPGELHSDRGGSEVELPGPIPAAARSELAKADSALSFGALRRCRRKREGEGGSACPRNRSAS